jgi:hypothetical protein
MINRTLEYLKAPRVLLLLAWCGLTTININKAFHIDDTFHLEVATHIKDHPLHPMSGMVNWDNDPKFIHQSNHPPLFFYLMAGVISVFGVHEVPLHLLLAFFTFLALYYFQKLTLLQKLPFSGYLLILFAFCPALIVNQNLMVDIPILALLLGAVFHLQKAGIKTTWKHYFISASLVSLALFMKYSLLPFLIIIALVALIRKHFSQLIILLIPAVALYLWSQWNLYEFGKVHLFHRWQRPYDPNQLWAFLACLGAVSPFTFAIVFGLIKKSWNKLLLGVLTLFFLTATAFYFQFIAASTMAYYLNLAFLINGCILALVLIYIFVKFLLDKPFLQSISSPLFIYWLLLGGFAFFLVRYAPFPATRHILLLLPFILLLAGSSINRSEGAIKKTTLYFSIFLGVALGVSDWQYANYYRTMAQEIELPSGGKIWSVGHWGWQWYAQERGMTQYHTTKSDVKPGDYLIYPYNIAKQRINEKHQLRLIDKQWEEANLLTFISGKNFASMYNSFLNKPPWELSRSPVDTIMIYQVEKILE